MAIEYVRLDVGFHFEKINTKSMTNSRVKTDIRQVKSQTL